MAKVGRPSDYKIEYCDLVFKLALLGATEAEMAGIIGVSLMAIARWKNKYEEFRYSLNRGRDEADAAVAKSLYQRALGYSHKAVRIMNIDGKVVEVPYVEHYPPDTTACIFWLKNRQKKLWRDRHEIEHRDGGGENINDDELEKIIRSEAGKNVVPLKKWA